MRSAAVGRVGLVLACCALLFWGCGPEGAIARPEDAGLPALPDASPAPDATAPAPDAGQVDGGDEGPFVSFADPGRTLQIVAHPDDDLWLQSPNVLNTMRRGHAVEVVYLTDGAAGLPCTDYALSRAKGMFAAYAQLLDRPGTFPGLREERVGDKTVLVAELEGAPVRLVFLGLSNPPIDVASDLVGLWEGVYDSIETSGVDGRSTRDTYTRESLIDTLKLLIEQFAPSQVNMLDASQLQPTVWPFDHAEHIASALFALSAVQRARPRPSVRMFRGYNIQGQPENVAEEEAEIKKAAVSIYGPYDSKICSDERLEQVQVCGLPLWCDLPSVLYVGYEHRQYPIALHESGVGQLIAFDGTCLSAGAEGMPLQLRACDVRASDQRFQLRRDGTIVTSSPDGCLAEQRSSGGVRRVIHARCDGSPEQQFALTSQGQLRGPVASCAQVEAGQLTLGACGWNDRQLNFSLSLFGAPFVASSEATSNANQSLLLVSLQREQRALCERRKQGLFCADYLPGQQRFGTFEQLSEHFSDEEGFGEPNLGSLQFADLDGDGRGDVCGVAKSGLYCAWLSEDGSSLTGFTRVTLSSSEAAPSGSAITLRLLDLSGDGLADVCMRTSTGVACAVSEASRSFAQLLTSDAFSDAAGFVPLAREGSLQLGDVNGDERSDLCARGEQGVVCALNDGRGALRFQHLFSHPGELSDAAKTHESVAGWGSIRVVDVNRDARADVCAVLEGKVRCGLSTGSNFNALQPVWAAGAVLESALRSDAAGTLSFADLNFDGRLDVCLQTGADVHCAHGLVMVP